MQTVTVCPVCNSGKHSPFVQLSWYTDGHYEGCQNCGAAFLTPRMDDRELDEWYRSGAYRERTAQGDPDNLAGKKQEQDRAIYLGAMIKGDFKSHLDIGCYHGALLREIRKNRPGIQSIGVDPALEQDEFAVFADMANVPGQFALVTIIQTLEHVNDPQKMVEAIYDHTAPGGTVICEVPNRRACMNAFLPPQHVVAYDEKSLRFLFADFTGIEIYLHGMPQLSPLDESILLIGHK
jgi:SAM-dependent methyltransferase